MKNYKIAWRNLWRNKRRSLITVASVFFAVFFALILRSLQLGSYDHMFRNAIESYTGYIQIQNEDFRENSSPDNSFVFTPEIRDIILKNDNVSGIVPRFESFALASSGSLTKGVLVMGIEPNMESLLSNVREKLVKYKFTEKVIEELRKAGIPLKTSSKLDLLKDESYISESMLQMDLEVSDAQAPEVMPMIQKASAFNNSYITTGKQEALVGDRLARYLKLNIGDTIVLIGQGYHGTSAAGKFRIAGIVKMPTSDIDNKLVYLPLDVCQEFYNAPGMTSSLALAVRSNKESRINGMINTLGKQIPAPLRLLGWREMNDLLLNQMDADNKSGGIMVAILYIIITFGIFGTVLMMTAERKREFGVLVAIGMQKSRLAAVVSLEMLYIGLLGILSGIAAALPVILFGQDKPIHLTGQFAKVYESYGMEPIMPFMPVDTYFLWQSMIIALIVGLAIIYPVIKIYRMKLVNSLKA